MRDGRRRAPRGCSELIGIGLSGLQEDLEEQEADLFDGADERQAESERVIDLVRQKFGDQAIMKGRGMSKSTK